MATYQKLVLVFLQAILLPSYVCSFHHQNQVLTRYHYLYNVLLEQWKWLLLWPRKKLYFDSKRWRCFSSLKISLQKFLIEFFSTTYFWWNHETMFDEGIFNDDSINITTSDSGACFDVRCRSEVPFCLAVQRIDRNTAWDINWLGQIFDIFQRSLKVKYLSIGHILTIGVWGQTEVECLILTVAYLNTIKNWSQNTRTKFNRKWRTGSLDGITNRYTTSLFVTLNMKLRLCRCEIHQKSPE